MDFLEFQRSFTAELRKLKLPDDCVLREPDWLSIRVPLSWQVDVVLEFKDNNHIYIWENHDRFAKLQICRRIQWSYHYGPITVRDSLGHPTQGTPDDPLEIRIDTCGGEPHLHYQQREPHYSKGRVIGIEIDSIDAIAFIKAVFKRRRTGKTFQQVMGFRLDNGK